MYGAGLAEMYSIRPRRCSTSPLFADVGPWTTLGLETNVAAHLVEEAAFLLMPQVHQEFTDHVMVQGGFGVEILPDEAIPLLSVRAIYTF